YEERCLTYAQPITTVTRNRNFVSMVLITRIIIIVGERKKDRETEREREGEREREKEHRDGEREMEKGMLKGKMSVPGTSAMQVRCAFLNTAVFFWGSLGSVSAVPGQLNRR